MKPFFLFSGSSNPDLSAAVADRLGHPLDNVEITRFIDNECRVRINEEVDGHPIFVIQSLSQIADQHLVELCLIGQALKSLKAQHVTAIIPWMGYSKQDKAFRPGESVSAGLVAKFIEAAGFDHVITLELHSENLIPLFKIPVRELSTHELLIAAFRKAGGDVTPQTTVVVSPDAGGEGRSARFAKEIGLPIVYLTKTRDRISGEVVVTKLSGPIRGKDAIIFDDIINTGGTAIKTSNFLRENGGNRIYFLATHPVLAGDASLKLHDSSINQIIVTDTIAVPRDKFIPKLSVISCASLLSDVIAASVA